MAKDTPEQIQKAMQQVILFQRAGQMDKAKRLLAETQARARRLAAEAAMINARTEKQKAELGVKELEEDVRQYNIGHQTHQQHPILSQFPYMGPGEMYPTKVLELAMGGGYAMGDKGVMGVGPNQERIWTERSPSDLEISETAGNFAQGAANDALAKLRLAQIPHWEARAEQEKLGPKELQELKERTRLMEEALEETNLFKQKVKLANAGVDLSKIKTKAQIENEIAKNNSIIKKNEAEAGKFKKDTEFEEEKAKLYKWASGLIQDEATFMQLPPQIQDSVQGIVSDFGPAGKPDTSVGVATSEGVRAVLESWGKEFRGRKPNPREFKGFTEYVQNLCNMYVREGVPEAATEVADSYDELLKDKEMDLSIIPWVTKPFTPFGIGREEEEKRKNKLEQTVIERHWEQEMPEYKGTEGTTEGTGGTTGTPPPETTADMSRIQVPEGLSEEGPEVGQVYKEVTAGILKPHTGWIGGQEKRDGQWAWSLNDSAAITSTLQNYADKGGTVGLLVTGFVPFIAKTAGQDYYEFLNQIQDEIRAVFPDYNSYMANYISAQWREGGKK